jgi:hypothetical protein
VHFGGEKNTKKILITLALFPILLMLLLAALIAVAYILSVPEQRVERNLPKNASGRPYVATLDYAVLPRLASQHPSFRLENLAPEGFEPKVGGLAFRDDGKLVAASWDKDGAVFLVDSKADRKSKGQRIAELLHEPLGLTIVDNRLRSETSKSLWTAEAWYTLNAIPQRVSAAPVSATSEDGWRDIFDGETLAGWRNYGGDTNAVRKWEAHDGTLALVQSGPFPMWDMIKSAVFGGPGGDLVYYRETFQNFELGLQWKISPGGNSGIFYLVKDETENISWRTGIEMQVLDNEGHRDGQIKTHRAGSLYGMVAADPETARAPGEWNDVLLRVKDNRIEHWLNGVKVVSIERGSDKWNALAAASKFADMPDYGKVEEGYLVLQDHGDPVWYRNIRVRNL